LTTTWSPAKKPDAQHAPYLDCVCACIKSGWSVSQKGVGLQLMLALSDEVTRDPELSLIPKTTPNLLAVKTNVP
jgi:hypothetical protein